MLVQLHPCQFEVVTKKMLPNLFTAYNLFQAFVQLERKYEAVNMKQKQKINKKNHIMNSEYGKTLDD